MHTYCSDPFAYDLEAALAASGKSLAEEARAFVALPREARHRKRIQMVAAGDTPSLTAAHDAGVLAEPRRGTIARNAHPNVLPCATTLAECDAVDGSAEKDVAVHLPTFVASRTTGTPKRGKGVIPLEDLPAPTRAQLERHRQRFGPECVDLAAEKRDAKTLRREGLSVSEIARVLRLSERAVKARLRSGEATPTLAI